MGDKTGGHGADENLDHLLIDSVTDYAIFALNPNGYITTWNPGAQRLKGYAVNEIIGQHFSRFYTPEDQAAGKPARLLKQALADGRVQDEGWRVRRDGTRFWAWVVISAMRGSDGSLKGFAKVTRDLTERRRSEENRIRLVQLREAARVRDEFLAYISHEMRTPLASLQLQLELLRRQQIEISSEKAAKIIDRIGRSYVRLAELVESILEQSRIQAGRLLLRSKPIYLVRMVTEVIEELRPEADRKGLRLGLSNQAEHSVIDTDANFLRVILVNLIGNAVKFTPSGAVDIGISSKGTEYKIHVRDEGPGIRTEDQERIFEPFERIESLEHKHTSGFGLGLATSKRLSDALGARIELESQLGSGSTFTLVLSSQPPQNGPED
jgi:PAS domain S-box-containing protein